MSDHRGFNVPLGLVEQVRAIASRQLPVVDLVEYAVLDAQEVFPAVFEGDVRDRAAEHQYHTEWSSVQVRNRDDDTIVEVIREIARRHDLSMDEVVRRSLRWYLGVDRDVGTRVIADGQVCCLVRDLGQYFQVRGIDGREHFFDAESCRIEGVLDKAAA